MQVGSEVPNETASDVFFFASVATQGIKTIL